MKSLSFRLLKCIPFAAASLGWANAASVTVPNFSFQTNETGDNGEILGNTTTGAGVSDWVASNGTTPVTGFVTPQAFGTADPNDAKFPGYTGNNTEPSGGSIGEGGQAVFLNTGGVSTSFVSLTSANAITTIASQTIYTLTVAVGNPLGGGTSEPGLFRIELLANGVEFSSFAVSDANLITDGTFANFSTSVTTSAASSLEGQALTIRLSSRNDGPNGNSQIFFDNVRLDATAVPEPGSSLMIGAAALLFATRRSRRASR